jgi:hypothetical protein
VRFSWRVVAKRKDVQAARLARYDMPNPSPPHIPDPHAATDAPATGAPNPVPPGRP